MKIKVKLFAFYRQIAGRDEIVLQIPSNRTISWLEAKLMVDFPEIDRLSIKPLISVNAEFASADHILKNGDIVALLPPFSGGQ